MEYNDDKSIEVNKAEALIAIANRLEQLIGNLDEIGVQLTRIRMK